MKRNLVRFALVCSLLFIAAHCLACSCIGSPGLFLIWGEAVLPRNAIGVPWWGDLEWKDGDVLPPDSTLFTVERWSHSAWVPIPFQLVRIENELTEAYHRPRNPNPIYLVYPTEGFRPKGRYRFHYSGRGLITRQEGKTVWDKSRNEVVVDVSGDRCEAKSQKASIQVVDHSFGEVTSSTLGGSCAVTLHADRETIAIDLPSDWKRWSDVLLYTVTVQGVGVWRPDLSLCTPTPPGTSILGPGQEMLFSDCRDARYSPSESDLPAGKHRVEFTAWLPGTQERVTGTIEVDLACVDQEGRH